LHFIPRNVSHFIFGKEPTNYTFYFIRIYIITDPGIDGRIILRWIFRKWDVGVMDWLELAQDSGRYWALVNAVMNLQVP
jgi:hypothetical protein